MKAAHSKPLRRLCFVLACLLLAIPLLATAQTQPLYDAVSSYLQTQTQGLPGKVSYSIGQLDSRTQLSACDAFEPFLPAGNKLWGKATIGVRCLGPAVWTVYIPVHVRVTGSYLIAARTMSAGFVISAGDVTTRDGDLGTLPATIVTDERQAIGKTLRFGIAAGQPLRSDQLIAPLVVQQGQNVRTLVNGSGFSVSSEGRALNNASEGQRVQVRTASGQTVSGIARANGVVEINQ